MKAGALTTIFAAMMAGGVASAQEVTNLVANHGEWGVFEFGEPKECWISSQPLESVNQRGGRNVEVDRGDGTLMYVTFRQGESGGEVSFTAGSYALDENRAVSVEIGGRSFEMYVVNDPDPANNNKPRGWAWVEPGNDNDLIVAMQRGATAKVESRSSRGTQSSDTFSLKGFTAAHEDAGNRCAG